MYDYRVLNKIILLRTKNLIPRADGFLDTLKSAKSFSKIYLKFGYHQVKRFEEDIFKISFRTQTGH